MSEENKHKQTEERFFLYIDILNFSNLIRQRGKVEELYEIINKLNVHRHDVFTTIILSDTILVYNKLNAGNLHDVEYIVMYLCEFAQDLFYRLIGRDIHFRAYITCDEFAHYSMENIKNVFYGNALIEAYMAEKKIQAMGLFMSNRVVPYSNIFKTRRFNKECHFVYIMQSLDDVSFSALGNVNFSREDYPLPPILVVDTDVIWSVAYDIRYLQTIHGHRSNSALSSKVKRKYERTWQLLFRQHSGLLSILEENAFDPNAVCQCDWAEPIGRVGTPDGCFG
jgi:hypothetical protein